MSIDLHRRTFLKGAGVAIAMPMMESLRAAPVRGKPVKRLVVLSNNYGVYHKAFFPTAPGADYELPATLKALESHRKDFTVFSNLDHGLTGGHACVPSFLSGVRPDMSAQYPEGNLSIDQRIAEYVGAATRYPSMTLKVKENNQISFTRTGVQVPSIDVTGMYRRLFLEDKPDAKKAEALRLNRHSSILDTVRGRAAEVNKQLSKQDQAKFEEYLHSVRGLEKKIVQQKPWLDRPKPKTEMTEPRPQRQTPDELKIMMELIALAIQTDSTRAITMTSGFANGDYGLSGGYHGFSHHGEVKEKTDALGRIEGGQIAAMGYLIDLLKKQEDPINGGTLFDNTMILYGCGMAKGTHSCKNLPLLLAGGGFRHNGHMVFPDEKGFRVPAANLFVSMLQNAGIEVDRFGSGKSTLRDFEWT
jgi:hypothetical protein